MQSLFDFGPLVVVSIPITTGLVQVIRQVFPSGRFAPLISLATAIGVVALTGATWQASIASGIVVGLAASGLYSGAKSTVSSVTAVQE